LPCSTIIIAATDVTALVIDAMRNSESAVRGTSLAVFRLPNAPE